MKINPQLFMQQQQARIRKGRIRKGRMSMQMRRNMINLRIGKNFRRDRGKGQAKSMKRLAKKMRIKFRVLDSKLPTTMAKHFREFSRDLDLYGKIVVDVKKKSRGLKQHANKLQTRLTALQNLVEQGLAEKMLWDLEWATDLEANQALMVMANLRLSDEASAIANQHKLLLEEPGQSKLCKEIPLNTMTKAYKKARDYIVRKSAKPNKYLKKTQPYISYRRSLESGLEVLQQNASNFAAEARKHFEIKW
ncbi:uncharacterized protein LOC110737844 [Chenopodium quinoa]|uniref:uncharacterized protein LOC110737844 n=1 Tax=Chenopodium quinoa TaxID=63459 RepID=UPI000B789917|nr:uncharacterized protein LOC110737844 [Chenopodium quinoa]